MLAVFLLAVTGSHVSAQDELLTIGAIQGDGDASPYRGDTVSFRGVVTGIQEDQNSQGTIYYTVFVQELPEAADGDPLTSDGIGVFFGTNRPDIPIGAVVLVKGVVTEYYGFTEIDDDDLDVTVENSDGVLPDAVIIDPPADLVEQQAYFEPLEGMRVTFAGPARVTGATHSGCAAAVVVATDPPEPIIRQSIEDTTGRVIPVLYPTDVDCSDLPQLKTGDLIENLSGALVYNFEEFKILWENPASAQVIPAELTLPDPIPVLGAEALSAVTINTHDWFDSETTPGYPSEQILLPEELALKETKLANAVGNLLNCPTLVAIQEVEHASLLENLATALQPVCGFTYDVSHVESADQRGIDNGLLSDPRRVSVSNVRSQQVCSPLRTDHIDLTIDCDLGDYPLFDRPPLQVDMTIDGRPYVAFVNHFKSKREGEDETALERLAQARFQNALVGELLDANPELPVLVMGDLNDYELSAPLLTLTDSDEGGRLVDALSAVPKDGRYSYVFSGVAGLLDAILVSPALEAAVQDVGILHMNTDYPFAWSRETDPELLPYGYSDHDTPWIIWEHPAEEPAVPTVTLAPPTSTSIPATAVAQATSAATPIPATTPEPATQTNLWPWIIGALVGRTGSNSDDCATSPGLRSKGERMIALRLSRASVHEVYDTLAAR
ncbi:MAG: hypothetical protein R3C44_13370 [Chloroflexota bacterium]